MKRPLLLAAGVALTVAGIALAVSGQAVPVGNPILLTGALVVVALSAAAVGGLGGIERIASPPTRTTLPDTGTRSPAPTPGARFDERLADLRSSDADAVAAVRERVRTAAIDALARKEGCSRSVAADRIDAGTWSEDERAVAFLRGDSPAVSVAERARAFAVGEPLAARHARHTVAELRRLADDE